jgi:hypothetical protein
MTERRGMPSTAEPGMAGDFADEQGAGLHEDLGSFDGRRAIRLTDDLGDIWDPGGCTSGLPAEAASVHRRMQL